MYLWVPAAPFLLWQVNCALLNVALNHKRMFTWNKISKHLAQTGSSASCMGRLHALQDGGAADGRTGGLIFAFGAGLAAVIGGELNNPPY